MSEETAREKTEEIIKGTVGFVVLFFALPQIFGWIAIKILKIIMTDYSLIEKFAIREIIGIVILFILGVMIALSGDD